MALLKPVSVQSYLHGVLNGPLTRWDRRGRKVVENYRDGVRTGWQRYYNRRDHPVRCRAHHMVRHPLEIEAEIHHDGAGRSVRPEPIAIFVHDLQARFVFARQQRHERRIRVRAGTQITVVELRLCRVMDGAHVAMGTLEVRREIIRLEAKRDRPYR